MDNDKQVGLIYKAIPAIMAEVGAISKDRENVAQRYKFRGIDDVYNAVHPLLTKYKVFTVPEILKEEDTQVTSAKGNILFYSRLTMRYTMYAEDGSNVVGTVRGEGMDSGDKASNKAMAVAHKYFFIQLLCIPTEEGSIDPENDSPEVIAARKQVDRKPEWSPEVEKPIEPSTDELAEKARAAIDKITASVKDKSQETKDGARVAIRQLMKDRSSGIITPQYYVESIEMLAKRYSEQSKDVGKVASAVLTPGETATKRNPFESGEKVFKPDAPKKEDGALDLY